MVEKGPTLCNVYDGGLGKEALLFADFFIDIRKLFPHFLKSMNVGKDHNLWFTPPAPNMAFA